MCDSINLCPLCQRDKVLTPLRASEEQVAENSVYCEIHGRIDLRLLGILEGEEQNHTG